jgi:hypothetical protein
MLENGTVSSTVSKADSDAWVTASHESTPLALMGIMEGTVSSSGQVGVSL